MFINDHPNLEGIIKYHFYYTYFKENFDYAFGSSRVDGCSQCESLIIKMKDLKLSANAKRNVAAELIIHRIRANKFYSELKAARKNTENKTRHYVAIKCKIYHYQTYLSTKFSIFFW